MKLSTRTRYGMRAVIELAHHEEKRPLQLKVIAERQGISVKYLEQLMSLLRSAGFVRSIRGSKGGYVLARPADQINVYEIFRCLEGAVTTAECTDDAAYCERAADCAAREIWLRVEEAIHGVLGSLTLADVVQQAKACEVEYQI
ncbi:MAG: Rrf2 family transcriptional regulator [Sedimentisphaerales bacterium]|nr:Rrf2 family transcriptional regulator [Sedimentisphaerales bacterium]